VRIIVVPTAFVTLLAETVAQAKHELESDVQRESAASRRRDALQIALYNLAKLETHVNRSRGILNDLRTLALVRRATNTIQQNN